MMRFDVELISLSRLNWPARLLGWPSAVAGFRARRDEVYCGTQQLTSVVVAARSQPRTPGKERNTIE